MQGGYYDLVNEITFHWEQLSLYDCITGLIITIFCFRFHVYLTRS
ncbi:unnamed protein product [Commensalibacter papalotli (ex Botero et al. 2024)]|uniref:Uncharacterized protein n=1 Tax=Commensalibacter papalotli (ex Botero et al. 2024) TaxID=2972766 RepID=A0ABM9HNS7_9PROT|nr:unnamed protein product [Commensalibacter papalotli (ex Botero et al. 2024)]